MNVALNADNKDTIAAAGAIPRLVLLLGPGSSAYGQQSAGALMVLAQDADNQVVIAGAIPRLVQLLGPGAPALVQHFVLSIPVARGANWFLAGGGRRMDEEEATAAAAERIAAAVEDGTSLPVRLATDVVRFLYGGTGRREPADGGVVSASLLNAKPAVGGIGVESRGGGVLRVLFTVASDAVADTVVRWRHELRRCVDSTAVFDVLTMASSQEIPTRQLYISGAWVAPVLGKYLDVVNPATEEVVGKIPAATSEDVAACVTAAVAAAASGHWTKTTGAYRATFLRKIASKITERREELARLETIDNGKPIEEAEWDVDDTAACFEYYAGLAEGLDAKQGARIDVGSSDFETSIIRGPLGVVALITPWNYPLLMATWKVAPALAAGNCCVLKPSELASLTCLELAAIAHEVGLPAGALSVLTGTGKDAGAPLTADARVAKIAFTGSGPTGRQVAAAAAANLRPASMELGGKSALLVFDDADVDSAVEWAMFGTFWTNGQICSATSRLLLQRGIARAFIERLRERAQSIKVCDPSERGCRMGALVSESQYNKVLGYVEAGKADGATLLTGGSRPAHLTRGFFLAPTVFTGVQPHMRIWREEIFGPVLSIMEFDTEADAIRLANESEFGLGGAVISKCPERCARVASALECGIVWVNCSQPCFCNAPWGGVKNSGHGRELGEWGLDNFLSVKQVTKYVSSTTWEWYPQSSKL
ncbi:hypothetical protein FOA52_000926 [Chlamydomonas sp. UWO 241]|nr:hypothetical protein FOA52_000926 [Chlamydomonas sp. UWO 241]